MHPTLVKLMATERTAAMQAAAAESRRRHVESTPRPTFIVRAARRALHPAHA
jgi:hypothetical protein